MRLSEKNPKKCEKQQHPNNNKTDSYIVREQNQSKYRYVTMVTNSQKVAVKAH